MLRRRRRYPPRNAPVVDLLRERPWLVVVAVVAIVTLVAGVLWVTRSPGLPGTPGSFAGEGTTCDEPCLRLQPRVTLGWTRSESGAAPTGYRVLRDDAPVAELGADTTTFIDDAVTMGETYRYQVAAVSDQGESLPTEVVEATVPMPPDEVAHLDGIYRVRLRVRSARSIGSAFGISNPLPGKRGRDRWSFGSTCGDDVGACPSTWSGLEGEIAPTTARWTGTVQGLPARCRGSDDARAPIEVDLEAVDVGLSGSAWVVVGFRGTASVSFRCPGFPPASASVEVSGSREPV
jgi:hypothetical protein